MVHLRMHHAGETIFCENCQTVAGRRFRQTTLAGLDVQKSRSISRISLGKPTILEMDREIFEQVLREGGETQVQNPEP